MPEPLLLGIEIGGTKLQLGLGRGDGRILALERRAIEPARGAEGILAQIDAMAGPLLSSWGDGHEAIAAVGIGFGGPVDSERGVVTTSHQVAGWDGFPLAAWVRERLGVPLVALQNDADTAGLGEAWFGAGAGFSPLLYVTVGSGIGGGLIIDGEIYRGSGAGAMEIGHLEVVLRSDIGLEIMTLESVASGWSIGARAREDARRLLREGRTANLLLRLADGDPDRITAAHVAEAARQGDPEAASIIKQGRGRNRAGVESRSHAGRPPADHPRRRGLADRGRTLVGADPSAVSRTSSSPRSEARSISSPPPSGNSSWSMAHWRRPEHSCGNAPAMRVIQAVPDLFPGSRVSFSGEGSGRETLAWHAISPGSNSGKPCPDLPRGE